MTNTEQNTETVTDSTTGDGIQTGLSIQDLTLTLQIINLSASRGAFKADELTTVGSLHDRIFKFLDSIGAITRIPATDEALPSTESK